MYRDVKEDQRTEVFKSTMPKHFQEVVIALRDTLFE